MINPGSGELFGGGIDDLDQELLTHGAEEPFDLASALGAVRVEWTRRTPSFAHARSSQASTKADPLST
ncbi:hypothetical protein MSAR_03120 [Mycolicibacterium sarraceniae]|uniref:Uncharacterized protein n=1 Tax=Mycolicibacterium sarraceniae TaxID=1534348 RepID=A0A7I7SMR6_9MYCO|nr:hypothetical protein MSAR_03120 [Mycolicibacterium sarraceniae]